MFLDRLGGSQDLLGCRLRLGDNGVEFVRSLDEAVAVIGLVLDVRDLALGALDGFLHVGDVEADAVDAGYGSLARHRLFEPRDGIQDDLRLGLLVPAHVFVQEPATAIGLGQRTEKGLIVVLPDRSGRSTFSHARVPQRSFRSSAAGIGDTVSALSRSNRQILKISIEGDTQPNGTP